jgi:flagellar biogenesis protein FliO
VHRVRLSSPGRCAGRDPRETTPTDNLELSVKVYQILLILWLIVFAFWLVKQFKDHHERKGRK